MQPMPRRTLPLIQRRPETDWAAVVDELRSYGCSLRGIAGALGLAHSNVQKWQCGSTPNFEDGKALLQLLDQTRDHRRVEAETRSRTESHTTGHVALSRCRQAA
jgi:hypothetical protein